MYARAIVKGSINFTAVLIGILLLISDYNSIDNIVNRLRVSLKSSIYIFGLFIILNILSIDINCYFG